MRQDGDWYVLMRPVTDAHYIHTQDFFACIHDHVIPDVYT